MECGDSSPLFFRAERNLPATRFAPEPKAAMNRRTPKPLQAARNSPFQNQTAFCRRRLLFRRELRAFLRVLHDPAERGDGVAQAVALAPLLVGAGELTLLDEREHFG